jgi:hypothetical protein
LDARAARRKDRVDRERRLEGLAVAVPLTALAVRYIAVRDAEKRAERRCQAMGGVPVVGRRKMLLTGFTGVALSLSRSCCCWPWLQSVEDTIGAADSFGEVVGNLAGGQTAFELVGAIEIHMCAFARVVLNGDSVDDRRDRWLAAPESTR